MAVTGASQFSFEGFGEEGGGEGAQLSLRFSLEPAQLVLLRFRFEEAVDCNSNRIQ